MAHFPLSVLSLDWLSEEANGSSIYRCKWRREHGSTPQLQQQLWTKPSHHPSFSSPFFFSTESNSTIQFSSSISKWCGAHLYFNILSGGTPNNNPTQSCSSPSPTRRSSVASKASPSAENYLSNQTMGSNFQSPKKPATKKFSSPTKCAVSKAIAPRKKILSERNGVSESIFSNTQTQKTQHFDSKATFVNQFGNDSQVPDFDDDEQNVFVADSSSQPYDPLTNYLSPRPKFLRYQPNRRRQILMSPRNEQGVGRYGLGTSISLCLDPQKATSEEASSSVSSSQEESSTKQEEEEIDESDEESEEELEEERGNWVLRGLLKSFLVFVVLALCTSYTCSMKYQTPSHALQAVWDGYERVQDRLLEAVKNLEGCSGPFLGDGFEVGEMVEDAVNIGGVGGAAKNSDFEERESEVNLGFSQNHEAPTMSEDQVMMKQVEEEEEEEASDVGEMVEDAVNIGGVGGAAKNSDFEERESEVNLGFSQNHEAPTMSEDQVMMKQVEEEEEEEASDVAENSDLEETESEEILGSCQDHETVPPMSEEETRDVAVSHDNEEDKVADNSDLEETESEEILGSSQDHETPPMSEEEARDAAVSFDNEAQAAENPGLEETESEENLGFSQGQETLPPMSEDKALLKQFEEEKVVLEDDVKTIKERPFLSEPSILIGSVLGMCTIVASLVMGLVHHMKKKRATVATNDGTSSNTVAREEEEKKQQQVAHLGSSKNETQISEKVAAKETPEEEEEKKEQQNVHLGSSKKETKISEVAANYTPVEEELNHLSKAPPSIQMLSEFVVVEKKSMSMSKCSESVPVKARRPEMSKLSSNNSCESYARSMTAEKKMVKKSSGGKENLEVATPVRRSSRIRSRSITSP